MAFHSPQSADGSSDSPTPSSLYKLSALLLHRGLVTLEDLYPHVSTIISVCACVCFHNVYATAIVTVTIPTAVSE